MSTNLNFKVLGVGAWGLSFRNGADLRNVLAGQELEDDGATGPKPEIIPANERRRAPLSVRLAVESSWQAVQSSGVGVQDLACVFVSGLGDTQLTDYMCTALAKETKALSPTKFHNSVHNAAAGYWTISTGCMQAANSIAAFQESASATLLEAVIQAQADAKPLLLTFYDAPVSAKLKPMLKNEYAFSLSFVIAPCVAHDSGAINVSVESVAVDWPALPGTPELQACYANNPAARILALAALSDAPDGTISRLPLSAETALSLQKVS